MPTEDAPLPDVKVDDISESIVAANSLVGAVQVRINDVEASAADIQSLQPNEVEKMELIDRPGVRYGEEVGIVINIVTRRVASGYIAGASGTYVPKAEWTRGNAYTRWNSGNTELSVNYSGAYSHSDGMSIAEQTDYLIADDTYRRVERNTYDIISRSTSHHIQTRYSWMDAERSAFLATLSTSIADSPLDTQKTDVAYPDGRKSCETADSQEKAVNPLLDLYWRTHIGRQQTFIANATGAYTHTDYAYQFASDRASFGYGTLGKAWSFKSEAIYENRLKPFTLTTGLRYNQKYIDNDYTGDATLVSQIRASSLYAFAQPSPPHQLLQVCRT